MSIDVISWVLKNPDACPEDKTHLVAMICLADWCDDEGVCYPSVGKLAHKCRLKTNSAARRVLADLESRGQIYRDIGGGAMTAKGPTNRTYLCKYRESIGLPPTDDLIGKGNHLREIGKTTGAKATKQRSNGKVDGQTVQDGTPTDDRARWNGQTVQDGTVRPCKMERSKTVQDGTVDPSVVDPSVITISNNRQSSSVDLSPTTTSKGQKDNDSHSHQQPTFSEPHASHLAGANSPLTADQSRDTRGGSRKDEEEDDSHSHQQPSNSANGLPSVGQNSTQNLIKAGVGITPLTQSGTPDSREDADWLSLCEVFTRRLDLELTAPRSERLSEWLTEYGYALMVECITLTADHEPDQVLPYLGKTLKDQKNKADRAAVHREALALPPSPAPTPPADALETVMDLARECGASHVKPDETMEGSWLFFAMSQTKEPFVMVGDAYVNGSAVLSQPIRMSTNARFKEIPEDAMEVTS